MATMIDPTFVYALLAGAYGPEEAPLRVYQYHRRDSERTWYAAFWSPDHDDIATSPEVVDYVLLWADEALTPIGRTWVRWWEKKQQMQTLAREAEALRRTAD